MFSNQTNNHTVQSQIGAQQITINKSQIFTEISGNLYNLTLIVLQLYGYYQLSSTAKDETIGILFISLTIFNIIWFCTNFPNLTYKCKNYGNEVYIKDLPTTKNKWFRIISSLSGYCSLIVMVCLSNYIGIFPMFSDNCPENFGNFACISLLIKIWIFSIIWISIASVFGLAILISCAYLCCGSAIEKFLHSVRRTTHHLPNVGPLEQIHWIANRLPITEEAPDDICSICREVPKEGDKWRNLPCNHKFHPECIDGWLIDNRVCPICRQNAKKLSQQQV
jgi:hypothetical protein